MSDERELMTWDDLGAGSHKLAELVHEDGYAPDMILAIARGGLLVAGALAYTLGVKNTFAMNVEYYTGVDERLDVPVILPPSLDLVDLSDAHLLIVDDVADTGETLALVADTVRPQVEEVRTAVLYEKSRSIVKCDYVWRRTDDWIMFPWSSLPPVPGAVADESRAPSYDGAH